MATQIIQFSGAADAVTIELAAADIGAGISENAEVIGRLGKSDVLQITMGDAVVVDLSRFTFTDFSHSGYELNDLILFSGDQDAETFIGSANFDRINGGGGNDTYVIGWGDYVTEATGGGNDWIRAVGNYSMGAEEVERLSAYDSASTVAVTLRGNGYAQIITGNSGDNAITGGGGADTMIGLDGSDFYGVDDVGDVIVEAAGRPGRDGVVVTSGIAFTLADGVEVEVIEGSSDVRGNAFAQTIYGTTGNDRIDGGGGADTLSGYTGNDTYVVDHAGDVVDERASQGTADFVIVRVSYSLGADAEVEKMSTIGVAGTAGINLTGNGFAQVISGNNGANVIIGGGGSDTMSGYGGNDTYVVDSADDIVVDGAGQGTLDWVRTSGGYSLGTNINIERLSAIESNGAINFNLLGNEIAQEIWGNAGRNRIAGNGGADFLKGFGGNDTFVYTNAAHSSPGLGRDFIQDFEDYGDDDTIDLTGFAGTLTWRGTGAFTGPNQVRAYQSGSHIIVQINSTGTTAVDAEIVLTNTLLADVTAGDFIL